MKLMIMAVVTAACSSTTVTTIQHEADGGLIANEDAADGRTAAACVAAGGDCRGDANACCNGTACVFDPQQPSKAVCAAICLKATQCASGCCKVLIAGTAAVCAPEPYCATACAGPGQGCAQTPCCANAVCVDSTVTGLSCAARCAASIQCASGCCAPLSNTGDLVCSPAVFCK